MRNWGGVSAEECRLAGTCLGAVFNKEALRADEDTQAATREVVDTCIAELVRLLRPPTRAHHTPLRA